MKRVAFYARYSDEKQNDSSIEQQMRMLHDRAAREGWTIVAAFEDRKLTGKNTFRPGYNAMLAAAYDGKFDILLSESVDRLGRDIEGLAAIHKRFNHRGLEIVTLMEGVIDDLQIGFKGTMAALYSKDLGRRVYRGSKNARSTARALAARATATTLSLATISTATG